MAKYKIVGTQGIAGAAPGETVELDPEDRSPGAVNVKALLEGGHLEEVSVSAPKASATAKEDKGK